MTTTNLFENPLCVVGPDEAHGVIVIRGQVHFDGVDDVGRCIEHSMSDGFIVEFSKPAIDEDPKCVLLSPVSRTGRHRRVRGAGGLPRIAVHDGWTPYRRWPESLTSSVGHHLFRGPWAAFEDGQSWAEELSTLLCATHERVEAAKVAETTAPPTRTLNSLARRHDELNIAGHAANSLPTRTHRPG